MSNIPHSEPASLYLHVPFCRSMCRYCGCHTKITTKDQPIIDYLGLVRHEIRGVAEIAVQPLRVEKIHFGGGTPTFIEPAEFVALTDLLRDCNKFSNTTEMAVEIDPRTLTIEMAGALGGVGIGRGMKTTGSALAKRQIVSAGRIITSVNCDIETYHRRLEKCHWTLIIFAPAQTDGG
ncbi:radical SAM protein [Mesorhizobium sp. A623]